MIREFEGKTEQEAIDIAISELGLERDDFDVEIIDQHKKTLFKRGSVKIRVHIPEPVSEETYSNEVLSSESENEEKILEFIQNLITKMGYECKVNINFRKDLKLGFNIDSPNSSIIIGRKGKNLDAIQLLANVYAAKLDEDYKIIIDSEDYRMRHEEYIVRNAFKNAEYVRKTGKSKLLEPMNPFERRLIHTALNDFNGVETKSEGDGLYKQVRIIPVKNK
ncbi:RNA-binding cell elongation regulator Jag/EloR [Bullifex porci]|uniref:RNA-binding cell elongation regulator Jag/EloR n=1 Tax=Bullifex porci TaxID=2606638 RepID=UPI0023F1BABD|nr:RNA-binding cell elongation regulator Jag/EloR [Bullifex porci]MDD7254590.1 protein jag [Bullifex porci]MDY2741809.1 RNA-binding cell elongation regulator Jag/EloR [Bullifex porci]